MALAIIHMFRIIGELPPSAMATRARGERGRQQVRRGSAPRARAARRPVRRRDEGRNGAA